MGHLRPITLTTILILVISLLLTSAGCDETADKSLTFSGMIVDEDTQSPLDSAWVVLDDTLLATRYYSDSAGEFQVTIFGVHLPEAYLYIGRVDYQTIADTLYDVRSNVPGLHYELERTQ
jgi:hypothetical protein